MGDTVDEVEEHGGSLVSREEFNAALDTLKTSMTTEVESMFTKFLEGLKLSTAPLKVVEPTDKVTDANSDKGEETSDKVPSSSGINGSGTFAHVEPPLTYGGPVPSTHLNHAGSPPKIVKNEDFDSWVYRFKHHLNHVNTNLWRIIEQGFYPHDPSNFTPREAADNQVNESALFIIQDAIPFEDIAHLRPFTVAKEAWQHIVSIYKGSARIQRSNYEVVQDEADEFAMNEDEEPRELYRRLTTLVVSLRDHGSKDTDDNWIKRKFLKAMMPYHKAMSFVIRQRLDFHALSSSEVLDEFVATRILDKTADNAVLRSQRSKKPNLSLKAKASVEEEDEEEEEDCCPEDTKYAYHEHMALASRKFWGKKNSRPNFNKNNSSGTKGKQCVRACYNCGNVSHFVAECPYKKREDNGGKLIRKDKAKSFPNKNNFTKRTPPKGLVAQEEYNDDDDDDEDGETVAMASVAIAKTPRVSLFDSPNENITAKCLMAQATNKVTPNIKTTIITNPSLTDCIDESEGTKEEEKKFESFVSKLKGKSKKHFVALLEQLGEANDMIEAHEETISKMEGHSHYYADEISDLSNALEEERGNRSALEESHNNDHAKIKKDLDHALVVSRVLNSDKAKLGVDHARLKEEFDILDKAHKALKGAHAILKESHDQFQVKLTKEKATFPHMVLIDKAVPLLHSGSTAWVHRRQYRLWLVLLPPRFEGALLVSD